MHSEFESTSEDQLGSDNENEEKWALSDSRSSASPLKQGNEAVDRPVSNGVPRKLSIAAKGMAPKPKPGLTLEDIRAGLGMSGSRSTAHVERSEPREFHDSSSENAHHDPSTVKLLNLAFELLEFTQLIENSRAETAREWTEKTQVVRQFERLYDSVRDREALFRGKVAEQRKKFQIREGKYFNLKKRARQHLREWQADRDRFAIESAATKTRIEEIEAELSHVMAAIAEQREHLSDLRNKAKNMPSEKETTDLNLKLRSLQNENAQLLTDRATLKLTLDELAATLQKRLPAPSTPESLTQVFNTVGLEELSKLRSPRLEDSKYPRSRAAIEIAELEKTADELQDILRQEDERFRVESKELNEQKAEFEEYKRTLQAMVFGGAEEVATFT